MPVECPCAGHFDASGRHYVWIAFLNIDNDQYAAEQRGRDYRLVPMNAWTVWLSNSPWFHCQLLFWNEKQSTFVTFTVNSYYSTVLYDTRKQFSRGWRFYRIETDAQREAAMYDFLVEEYRARTPFNQWGALALYVRPIDAGGRAWFCSELVVAALQRANYALSLRAHATGPAALMHSLEHSSEFAELTISANPRDVKTMDEDERNFDDA